MKRKVLILLTILIPQIYAFSQTISNITVKQIKIANKIFLEHKKYSELVPLLENKIDNLNLINKNWEKQDSLNKLQLTRYTDIVLDQTIKIDNLNKSIKIRNKIIKYGAIGTVTLILSWLIQK